MLWEQLEINVSSLSKAASTDVLGVDLDWPTFRELIDTNTDIYLIDAHLGGLQQRLG